MGSKKIRLIKIVYDVMKDHGKADLHLSREIVEALAVEEFFNGEVQK